MAGRETATARIRAGPLPAAAAHRKVPCFHGRASRGRPFPDGRGSDSCAGAPVGPSRQTMARRLQSVGRVVQKQHLFQPALRRASDRTRSRRLRTTARGSGFGAIPKAGSRPPHRPAKAPDLRSSLPRGWGIPGGDGSPSASTNFYDADGAEGAFAGIYFRRRWVFLPRSNQPSRSTGSGVRS